MAKVNKIIAIIIKVAIPVLWFTIIFLFIQNQNFRNEIGILNNKIADLEKQKLATPTPVAEKPPQGWREYIDEEYKFRVWYPEKFSYEGITDQTKIQKLKYKEENLVDFYVNVLSDAPLRLLYIYIS